MQTQKMSNSYLTKVLPQIARSRLDRSVTQIKPLGGGSFGKAFSCTLDDGRTIVLKAYRADDRLEHDALSLTMLRQSTSVTIPQVYFTHRDESCCVLAMDFIRGKNVLDPAFLFKKSSQKKEFSRAVIKGLLEIHGTTAEKYGALEAPEHTSWLEFYREAIVKPQLAALNELCENGKYNRNSMDLLLEATELFFKHADEPDKPVLIHADLNIMNIMADPKTFELTGFIDPGDSMWADREYDLFQLLNMWGSCYGLLEEYKKAQPLSEHHELKIAYYAALNEASCRLKGGLIMPVWEIQCNNRLKKAMQKY